MDCVLSEQMAESSIHVFLRCHKARSVWALLMGWLEGNFVTRPNVYIHWECWNDMAPNKRVRKGFRLIWHATIWTLWKTRKDKVFNNEVWENFDIVEAVKVLAWRWSLTRMNISACLFYEWCWNPKFCLQQRRV